ncbi:MAG: tRNA-intron endonuclease, partial [Halovenus sp.]
MDIRFDGERLRAGSRARERFYDSRGYGQPREGNLELAPVEAAHLLFRGDIERVLDSRDGEDRPLGFGALLASTAVSEVSFFVYKDLRDRGFYLSPTRDTGEGETDTTASGGEFVVYPRGRGPWDDAVAYRVRSVSEREAV